MLFISLLFASYKAFSLYVIPINLLPTCTIRIHQVDGFSFFISLDGTFRQRCFFILWNY